MAPDAKARLNGNVQGVLTRGDEAITALRSWLTNGHTMPTPGAPDPSLSYPIPPDRASLGHSISPSGAPG